MAEWITWYNSERLNGAIFYLTPDEVFDGKMGQRLAERKKKLYDASIKRQEYWRNHYDELIEECATCPIHVDKAQEDLESWQKQEVRNEQRNNSH